MNMEKLNFGLALALAFSALLAGCTSNAASVPEESTVCALEGDCPTAEAGSKPADSVLIPLSEISTAMKGYTHSIDGVDVNYMVVLGSDGEVRTAFDACEVCGGSKGYKQDGTDIFCVNCGRYFSIDGLGTQNKGRGCWPAYLPHIIEGDSIIIKKSDLDKGRFLFA